ncbi:MAG: adenylate/guanylate cyclase domain-containing protein, partial [Bacteroidota bacterium]
MNFDKTVKPLLIKIAIGLGIGSLVVVLAFLLDLGILRDVEALTVDFRFQQRSVTKDVVNDGNVVIVKISDEDIKALPGSFPFPRSYYAHVIENLNRAGAVAVVLDLTLTNPGEGDDELRAVLQKYDNVILGVKASTEEAGEQFVVRSRERRYDNAFYDVNKRVGVVNVVSDRDGVVRRYLPMVTVNDFLTPTLAFAALNRAYRLAPEAVVQIDEGEFVYRDRRIPRFDPTTFMLNYYGPVETFRYISFTQAIDDEEFQTQDEIDNEIDLDLFDEATQGLFKNKIVLIGSTMAEERDYHTVPVPKIDEGKKNFSMHGVEIHATAIQNIIDQNFIRPVDAEIEILLIVFLAVVSFLVIERIKRIKLKLVALVEIGAVGMVLLLILGIAEGAVLAFTNSNLMMNIINPSLAIVFAYIGTAVYQYLLERQQKAMIKGVFSHYISAAVVNELVANPEKARLGGDRRELTVFFSDIAGFTTISEQFHNKPEGLVELLNEYLDEMTSIVLKHEGTLDKYEGDAIMAFWGAPIPQKDHALRTCLAALDMQKRLAQMRPKWKKEGRPPLEVRCGINTGVMIVGNMGGKDRFDYTVIGDSVNLASRLEGANKQYG